MRISDWSSDVCSSDLAIFGPAMPGILIHPGASVAQLVDHLYLTTQGIYGIALGVVATYVFHFVLFGVFATRIGLGQLFLDCAAFVAGRSEEHTSELQSLMRISYAVFCLKKKTTTT